MRKIIVSMMALLVLSIGAYSQTKNIHGKVLDADSGQPLIGVTVTVTGTKNITITDMDGLFSLSGINPSDKTITVSYVGMVTQTVQIVPEITIYMEPDSQLLQETVVVAFGKQTKEAFTGSATVVKSDELTRQVVSDPIKALAGKVPGMTVLSSSNPATESTINIRGLGSIIASTKPLVVVDGQPYDGSWRDINPNDIDNISVLKDAASNALYGARGANGVIMITTKSAQKGRVNITFDMKCGVSTDAQVEYDKIDNPAEYYLAHYQALKNYYVRSEGRTDSQAHLLAATTMLEPAGDAGGLGYILYDIPAGEVLIGSNGKFNPNATLGRKVTAPDGNTYTLLPDNWKKEGLRNGIRQEYNVSLSGGGQNFSVYASLGVLDQKGLSYGSGLKRQTARIKFDYQPFKWLDVGANANYSHSKIDNLFNSYSDAYNVAPIYPLYIRDAEGNIMQDERGNMYDYGNGVLTGLSRPYLKDANNLQSDKIDTYTTDSNAFGINGYVNFNIPLGFKLTINGSVAGREYRINEAYNPYYGYNTNIKGTVSTSHSRKMSENYQQLLSWAGKFGGHSIDVLAGHEYNRRTTTSISGSKSNVALFDENIELNGALVNKSISGSTETYNVEGWLARAQYEYDSRYFASASFRCDGSSRFHPKHRWGCFWSLGGAWIISKEKWFPKTDKVDILKLKVSYGEQGNDGLSNSYYWTDYYTISSANDEVAYTFNWKGNPDITWETTASLNAGVEFGFFKGRLSGSVEYYHRKTRDMLYFYSVPTSLGYSGYYDNIGDMVNTGVEVVLDGYPIRTRNFAWGLNLNFSYEKNHISRLPDSNKRLKVDGHDGYAGSYYFYGEGLPMYTWYLRQYMGPDEEGQPTYRVVNADGTESTTTSWANATRLNCGTALPSFYGGYSTSLSFFGVDISATFNFSVGGKKLDSGYQSLMGSPYAGNYGRNIHRDALKGWSESNKDAWIPRWQYRDSQNNLDSDFFLTDASYLSLQNVQIGYTFPSKWMKKIKVSTLRLSLACDGVAYWTARKGFDPRVSRSTYSGTGYGAMRTYLVGLTLKF